MRRLALLLATCVTSCGSGDRPGAGDAPSLLRLTDVDVAVLQGLDAIEISQVVPPLVERWTPVPSVATSRVWGSLGSTDSSRTTSSGQLPSWSALQVMPPLVLL